jgi:hypothetical protein
MIGISVGDLLKVLDQIPIWKAVSGLPKRIAELERRIDALESERLADKRAASQVPSARICPICSATMKVISETAHPQFDFAGVKIHNMRCDECGQTASRDFRPGTGYR